MLARMLTLRAWTVCEASVTLVVHSASGLSPDCEEAMLCECSRRQKRHRTAVALAHHGSVQFSSTISFKCTLYRQKWAETNKLRSKAFTFALKTVDCCASSARPTSRHVHYECSLDVSKFVGPQSLGESAVLHLRRISNSIVLPEYISVMVSLHTALSPTPKATRSMLTSFSNSRLRVGSGRRRRKGERMASGESADGDGEGRTCRVPSALSGGALPQHRRLLSDVEKARDCTVDLALEGLQRQRQRQWRNKAPLDTDVLERDRSPAADAPILKTAPSSNSSSNSSSMTAIPSSTSHHSRIASWSAEDLSKVFYSTNSECLGGLMQSLSSSVSVDAKT